MPPGTRNGCPARFRTDDRLAKTLLLSAVAPKVPALKELTAARLASLNHGSIKSPLPGSEAGVVLARVREWNRKVPEIHIGGDPRNPVIRVQLSDVDYESVVENAKGEDNEGRRRELLKDLVREAIGITERDPDVFGVYAHPVIWRGSRRGVDVVFGNVRDAGWLTEDHFRARPGTWRFVIDYPFDEAGHSAAEDLARVDRLAEGGLKSRTIVWLPRFLSEDRMREVRRLVILDWLLSGTGERWTRHADHLSEVDRAQARAILESQRTGLREALRRAVQECYGAAAPSPGTLAEDSAHDRVLVSLDSSFSPAAPVGADLAAAFGNLVDQAFSATYPGHPRFEPGDVEVTARDLAAVYAHVERAVADPERRVRLEGDIAAVRRVANPLQVGMAAETHFLFGDDKFPWGAEFERAAARDGVQPQDPVTVGQIRGWLDAIRPELGLRDEVADLIVLAWAALRQRAWYQHGSSIPAPRPGAARPDMQLRPEPLPDARRLGGCDLACRGAVRDPGQPVPDRGRPRRVHRDDPDPAGRHGRSCRGPRAAGRTGLPAPRPACRPPRPAGDRPRRGQARGGPAPGRRPGPAGRDPGQDRTARHRHGGRELAEAGRRTSPRRWTRSAGTGSARLRAAENQDDERGRDGRAGAAGAAGGGRGRRVRDQAGPALSAADDAVFEWLSAGQRVEPVPRPPATARTTCPSTCRPRHCHHGPGGPGHPGQGRPGQRGARAAAGVPGRAPRRPGGGRMAGAGVTVTATRATLPVLRALLDQARRKNFSSGVLGVRARPEWPGAPEFTHADVPVRVVPCVSALAVREALLERADGQWLVVLTDRPDDDLGAGVLSHLVWHRLRTPDPWDAVRLRFAATGVEPALTTAAEDRSIATGLLMAAPPDGWPPAPGGVLTRDHALGAVAAAHLGLTDPVIDATSVLAWTADPAVSTRVADLRSLAGDALAGAVLDWAAEHAGAAGPPLRHLLRAGEARDAVPLGLVAGLLAGETHGESGQLAREALIRLEPRFGGAAPAGPALRSWAGEAAAVVAGMLQDPAERGNGLALLARADELLAASRADALADGSDLLPSGLTRRLASLAGALRAAVAGLPRRIPTCRGFPPAPWPASSRPGSGWPPTGSRTATRGRRPSTPRCGWRAGWRETPRSARRPCRRWSAGTATATPGSTRPSATPPPG